MNTLKFACKHCGNQEFKFPREPQPTDEVTCAGCGRTALYADIQAAALDQGKNAVADLMSKTFGSAFKRR